MKPHFLPPTVLVIPGDNASGWGETQLLDLTNSTPREVVLSPVLLPCAQCTCGPVSTRGCSVLLDNEEPLSDLKKRVTLKSLPLLALLL